MIELFNPTIGNNEYDYYNNTNINKGGNKTGFGVKIFHVDSRMVDYHWNYQTSSWVNEPTDIINKEGMGKTHLTYIPNDNDRVDYDEHHNYYGKYYGFTDWENYHLLHLLQKGNVNTFETTDEAHRHTWEQGDLWQTGDTFCIGNHPGFTNYGPNFFYEEDTFNDGSELPYGITFDSVTANSATITFTYLG